DALWDYNKPAETEAKFRKVLEDTKSSATPAFIAELKTQIARALGLQQKFDEAHRLLDSVQAEIASWHGGSTGDSPSQDRWEKVKMRYLLERGRVFNSSKQSDEALPLFDEAWNLGLECKLDFYAVDAAHMMAIAAPSEQKLEWNQTALALAEKSSEPKARRWRASLYNNIGWDFFSQKKYDSALAMFEKAVPARIEQQQPSELRFAKWCVAKTQRMLGQLELALVTQYALEVEYRESGEGEDGYVFEEIAECLLTQGKPSDAKQYFAKAYALLSSDIWLVRDEPERLARMKQLGGVAE
ncbi:MAG: tetratricopeptide repeat protein, partial [Pirellulaceae bacterium]